jgi:outer membrane immunogenic protein
MRRIAFAALLALPMAVVAAAPASAQDSAPFTGARIGATVGYDHVNGSGGATYGGAIGYDALVGPNITLGAETTLEDSTSKNNGVSASRDLAVSARAGYILTPKLLAFAKVGYDTTRFELPAGHTNLEGVRYGGGLEYAVSKHTYMSVEYRRTSYEGDFGSRNAAIAGFGVRF